jgi:DNA-binding transcriptional regulator LsrR (DeoR family)
MSDAYSVSKTSLKKLEEVWLASREGLASHLQVHQCLKTFFEIIETNDPGLDSLFEEIGRRLDLPSHTVRQRFQEAKAGGTLRVGARLAVATGTELQRRLSELSESPSLRVIVGEVRSRYLPQKEDRGSAVAEAAADYFMNVVPQTRRADESKQEFTSGWIGVSGGNTMLNVVQRIEEDKRGRYEGLTVIPLAGEAEPEKFGISANSVALRLAQVCVPGKAETYSLMTTPIVGPRQVVDNLLITQETSRGVQKVIDLAKHVKFAFTGIGGRGHSKEEALARLREHCEIGEDIPEEVVGDICYRPIDKDGGDAWPELSRRLLGPTLDDLRKMSSTAERRVFAVACGKEKVEPIIAAVCGGLVNGLITDELTALDILEELRKGA